MDDTTSTRGTVDSRGLRYEWYTSRDSLLKRRLCDGSDDSEEAKAESIESEGNMYKRRMLHSNDLSKELGADSYLDSNEVSWGYEEIPDFQNPAPNHVAVRDADSTQSYPELLGLSDIEANVSEQDELSDGSSSGEEAACAPAVTQCERRALSHVKVIGPAFPRSAYSSSNPAIPTTNELGSITDLLREHWLEYSEAGEAPEYTFIQLDNFSIYRPMDGPYAQEMCPLHMLKGIRGSNDLRFDGTLSISHTQYHLVNIPFEILTLDGYFDDEVVDMEGKLCIQSRNAKNADVWYRLGRPSEDYRRFYTPFLWLANFTKFYVDFLSHNKNTCLGDFRTKFLSWLRSKYCGNDNVLNWLKHAGLTDFRTTVAANYDFLFKECSSLDHGPEDQLLDHQIWGEIDPTNNCLTAIPRQPIIEKLTLVSPYVHRCFRHMYFASLLKLARPQEEVADLLDDRKQSLGLTPYHSGLELINKCSHSQPLRPPVHLQGSVQRGDVVVIEADVVSKWQTSQRTKRWFAYVQGVRSEQNGNEVMDLIWLYHPEDTTLGTAFYPFKNELFFSDHCECGEDAFDTARAIGKVNVQFFVGDPGSTHDYFVRHKYCTVAEEGRYDFVTLKAGDFHCVCTRPEQDEFDLCMETYHVGSTVLVHSEKICSNLLQPGYITRFDKEQRKVVISMFERHLQTVAPANFLRLPHLEVKVSAENITRKCQVKVFKPEELHAGVAPGLYGRGGAGDFFYLVTLDGQQPKAAHVDLPSFIEGWTPNDSEYHPAQKLTGMSMFCGGGNFDRGLEEGGAVHFQYAVDLAERALHSYRANLEDPDSVRLFLGSVNDYLSKAIDGTSHHLIASIGEIQVIAAGSPCPGFSRLQHDKSRPNALRDASLVTSVVSYVDIYSPLYLVFENVVTMSNSMGPQKDQNVFRQVLAALLGLGYQIQQFTMYAPDYGSCQSRPRLFIVATAPGMSPWQRPPHTHASNRKVPRMSLGRLSNGLTFGDREQLHEVGVFPYISIEQATKDLPFIGDGQVQLCPSFPDHRTPNRQRTSQRLRIAAVPVRPRGMTFMKAYHAGLLNGEAHRVYVNTLRSSLRQNPQSTAYRRLIPDSFCPTMTKSIMLEDGIGGGCVHWDQHRILTVMESKRAQGFLDSDVIIGTPGQQQQIIGNSVDRKVALALGLVLREAWRTNRIQAESTETSVNGVNHVTKSAWVGSIPYKPLTPRQVAEIRAFGFKAVISAVSDSKDTIEEESNRISAHTPDLEPRPVDDVSENSPQASPPQSRTAAIGRQEVSDAWANQTPLRTGGTILDYSTEVSRDHAEVGAADCSVGG